MGAISFKRSSLENYNKYNSLLVGNEFTPPPADSSYDLLETTTLASSASSVTFSGLGSYTDYKHLQIRYVARTDRSNNADFLISRFNSDTTSNYARHKLFGNGSSVSSFGLSGINYNALPDTHGGNDTANAFGACVLDILDFSSSSKNTTLRGLGGAIANVKHIALQSGGFFKTDAITSIEFSSGNSANLVSGSRFSLFGIRG